MKSTKNLRIKLTVLVAFSTSSVMAGAWSTPAKIMDIGSWGPWFAVVVTDNVAAVGCAGNGIQAIEFRPLGQRTEHKYHCSLRRISQKNGDMYTKLVRQELLLSLMCMWLEIKVIGGITF